VHGRLRDAQGWIGGHDPTDAHVVTPPPVYLPGLLDDLVDRANRDDLDPIPKRPSLMSSSKSSIPSRTVTAGSVARWWPGSWLGDCRCSCRRPSASPSPPTWATPPRSHFSDLAITTAGCASSPKPSGAPGRAAKPDRRGQRLETTVAGAGWPRDRAVPFAATLPLGGSSTSFLAT
jgi:hypothetical protein